MLAAWSLNLCAWSLMLVAPSSRSLELDACLQPGAAGRPRAPFGAGPSLSSIWGCGMSCCLWITVIELLVRGHHSASHTSPSSARAKVLLPASSSRMWMDPLARSLLYVFELPTLISRETLSLLPKLLSFL